MARPQTQDAGVPESTQVTARGTRRRFTVEYKASIVQQAAQCRAPGEIGALLIVFVAAHAVAQIASGGSAAGVVAAPRTDDGADGRDDHHRQARAVGARDGLPKKLAALLDQAARDRVAVPAAAGPHRPA